MSATANTLNLPLGDGAVCVTFTPALSAPEYEQLLYTTAEVGLLDELEAHLSILGRRRGRTVAIEPC
jgi:hypothetical protein